jgi:hypothetical protein
VKPLPSQWWDLYSPNLSRGWLKKKAGHFEVMKRERLFRLADEEVKSFILGDLLKEIILLLILYIGEVHFSNSQISISE